MAPGQGLERSALAARRATTWRRPAPAPWPRPLLIGHAPFRVATPLARDLLAREAARLKRSGGERWGPSVSSYCGGVHRAPVAPFAAKSLREGAGGAFQRAATLPPPTAFSPLFPISASPALPSASRAGSAEDASVRWPAAGRQDGGGGGGGGGQGLCGRRRAGGVARCGGGAAPFHAISRSYYIFLALCSRFPKPSGVIFPSGCAQAERACDFQSDRAGFGALLQKIVLKKWENASEV